MAKKRIDRTEQLFGETESITTAFAQQHEGTQQHVPIEDLVPNRFNPRRSYSQEGLRELVHSMEAYGFIGALDGRPLPDGRVELAYGSRRLLAAKAAELRHIPVFLHDWNDDQMRLITLVENLSQVHLTLTDEADAIGRLNQELNLTLQEISTDLRKPQSWIQDRLALHEAPEDVQQMVAENGETLRSVQSMASIQDEAIRLTLRDSVLQQRLSPTQVQLAVQKIERGCSVSDALAIVGLAQKAETRTETHQSRMIFPGAEAVIATSRSGRAPEAPPDHVPDRATDGNPSVPIRAQIDSGSVKEQPALHTRQTQTLSAPTPPHVSGGAQFENKAANRRAYRGISDDSSQSMQLLLLALDALDNYIPCAICPDDTQEILDLLRRIENKASALHDELA